MSPPLAPILALQNISSNSSLKTLKTWSILMKHSPVISNITLADNSSTSSCQLTAVDCEKGVLHVRNLTSPIGNYSAALVRMNDIDRLECNVSSNCFDTLLNNALLSSDINLTTTTPTNIVDPDTTTTTTTKNTAAATTTATTTITITKEVRKYWSQRFNLFSKFNSIQTDKIGLFSATPECVAQHVAFQVQKVRKVQGVQETGIQTEKKSIWDAFSGVGGNCCHFSTTSFSQVIASDLSASRLEMAKHNCKVYANDNVEFIVGDFLELCKTVRADVVVLSPPWGGPKYLELGTNVPLDESITIPCNGIKLLRIALESVRPGGIVVYMLPKNVDKKSLVQAAELLALGTVEIEDVFVNEVIKMTIAYFHIKR